MITAAEAEKLKSYILPRVQLKWIRAEYPKKFHTSILLENENMKILEKIKDLYLFPYLLTDWVAYNYINCENYIVEFDVCLKYKQKGQNRHE